jgi:plasmid stability protein
MATLTIRKLTDDVYQRLKARAERHHRSLEAEVREILDREARSFDLDAWLEEVRELRKRSTTPLPDGMTTLDLLRQERESW